MCGICGVFGLGDPGAVAPMLATLRHRGPDDELIVGGAEFSLGARRLSIVDLQGGRQPLANETGSVWAAQNGELYNFPQVRERLLQNGHRLHTSCDTEVLPHLYEEYGLDLPRQIDGMFAVAVWDDVRKIGLLARDRTGKKPLYYWWTGRAVYFASELKGLLAIPGFSRRLNFEALHHFLSYKHVPHPLSIFEGVRVLPPAHMLIYKKGSEPVVERYWALNFDDETGRAKASDAELVDEFLALLRRGIERRLMSDVPVGFFLSGGLDSSLSAALATEVSPARIKTFTLTYESGSSTEGKDEDRRWARWVADRFGTEAHEEVVGAFSFPDKIREILRCFDEPFAGVTSTYFLSSLIARHVKVAVSGDGADELFGSYLSHRLAGPVHRYQDYRRTGDPNLIRPFEHQTAMLGDFARLEEWDWRSRLFVFTDEEKQRVWTRGLGARNGAVQHSRSSQMCLQSSYGTRATEPHARG